MASDQGNQTITVLYHSRIDSGVVNRRFIDIRKTGIYSGGYLTVVDNSHARLSTLISEISDGTYQIKATTGSTVTIAVSSVTPYIVLRWIYSGVEVDDYVAILSVASPATYDLVVGKCTFSGGGNLQGFDYSERTTPNTHDLFLKVEPTEETELRVRVRSGRVQNGKETIQISDQKTGIFTPPTSNSKIYLVYISRATGAILIDSSGAEAANPVAPNYAGKLVLAEVTLASGATNITSSMIKDVRDFTNMSYDVDNSSLQVDSNGKLAVKTIGSSQITSLFGAWLIRSSGTVYQATTDGFVVVYLPDNSHVTILTDANNPPTTLRMSGNEGYPSFPGGTMCPVIKNNYWKVTGTGTPIVYWLPIGS